jgi:hypothetical protein
LKNQTEEKTIILADVIMLQAVASQKSIECLFSGQ